MLHKTRVLIVGESRHFLEKVEAHIKHANHLDLVASVSSIKDAFEKLSQTKTEIVLIDSIFSNGSELAVIEQIVNLSRNNQFIIVISNDLSRKSIIEAMHAGASGYLFIKELDASLIDAIKFVTANGIAFSKSIAQQLISIEINECKKEKLSRVFSPLTNRETEVLFLISKGFQTKEIAELMGISAYTVKEYASNSYKKLSASNRVEAIKEALILGII